MFSLSDMFDKKKKGKDLPGQNREISPGEEFSVSNAAEKKMEELSPDTISQVYEQLFSITKQFYRHAAEEEAGMVSAVRANIQKIIDLLSADARGLLMHSLQDYPDQRDYLYYHAVNVCIISLDIALGLGLKRDNLLELGEACLLHDIGLFECSDIIQKATRLDSKDNARMKQHTSTGPKLLKDKGLSPKVMNIVSEEHERIDGSGYPKGLHGNQIVQEAKIIELADVYEALMHKRPYRNSYSALETIREILKNKNTFEAGVIKALIERIGIFPAGTPVILSTKEKGEVIRHNPDAPFRPVVKVLFDESGRPLEEPREVDLSKDLIISLELNAK